jgi:hypothetical protein
MLLRRLSFLHASMNLPRSTHLISLLAFQSPGMRATPNLPILEATLSLALILPLSEWMCDRWLSQIDISLNETGILAFWNGRTWVAEDKFLEV